MLFSLAAGGPIKPCPEPADIPETHAPKYSRCIANPRSPACWCKTHRKSYGEEMQKMQRLKRSPDCPSRSCGKRSSPKPLSAVPVSTPDTPCHNDRCKNYPATSVRHQA